MSYNVVAARIYIVGNINEPSIWENSRNFIDLQFTKSFLKKRLEFKFNIQNMLAERQIFYQNKNMDNSSGNFFNKLLTGDSKNKNDFNKNEDDLIWSTKFGWAMSLGVSYKF
jgi:hypothetical protein